MTGQFQKNHTDPAIAGVIGLLWHALSYKHVENLVTRITGAPQLSDQKVWQIVNDKAVEIGQAWRSEAEKTLNNGELPFPKTQEKVGIYDGESQEILVFEDAIQVRGQKQNRVHKQKVNKDIPSGSTEKTARLAAKEKSPPVFTNVVMLQKEKPRI
ncbi:MAG: hypothetical protein IPK63_19865 [Candidatus Competibacteraceae bacterium]|nr:hypothetical protein [Candidatus Competibacteraceae bacterium]